MVALFLCFSIMSCSGEKDDGESNNSTKPIIKDAAADIDLSKGADSGSQKQEGEEYEEFVDDLGVECETHEYQLARGESVYLDFGIEMKVSDWIIPWYENEGYADLEGISVEQIKKWGALDAHCEIEGYSFEPVSVTESVWAFDGTEMFEEEELVPGEDIPLKNNDILWTNDGYGVIESVLKAEETRSLSEDELRIVISLPGDLTFSYNGTAYELPLTQVAIEKTIYFVEIEVSITVPETYDEHSGNAEFWLQTMRGTDYLNYAKWPVKVSYNKKNKRFYVAGPGEYSWCY